MRCRDNRDESRPPPRLLVCDGLRPIGPGKVLVIEDLPELEANDPLWVRLEPLSGSSRARGEAALDDAQARPPILLHQLGEVSTCPVALPASHRRRDGGGAHRPWAPPEFVSKEARLIHLFCREHPFLIVAACLYLRPKAWRLGNAEFNAIVGAGTHRIDGRGHPPPAPGEHRRRGHAKAALPSFSRRRTLRRRGWSTRSPGSTRRSTGRGSGSMSSMAPGWSVIRMGDTRSRRSSRRSARGNSRRSGGRTATGRSPPGSCAVR